jgi:hypothetical protein
MSFAIAQNNCNVRALQRFGESVRLSNLDAIGVFADPYQQGNVGSAGMASSRPTLVVLTSAVPPVVIDWLTYFIEPADPILLQVVVKGDTYKIVAHEPDGLGLTTLMLEKVA